MNTPEIGSEVIMPCCGSDVRIRVEAVPLTQPLAAHGITRILDQDGAEHLVEQDGDTWVTTSLAALPGPLALTYLETKGEIGFSVFRTEPGPAR